MAIPSGWTSLWGRSLALTALLAALFAATPAAAQPVPSVSIVPEDFPPEVLIGEKFTFTVEFSNQGNESGAGPYIALCLPAPGADGSGLNLPCDGFFFVSAVEVYTGQTRPLQPAGPPLIQSPPGGPIACQEVTEGSTNPMCKPPIPLPPGFEGCQVVFLPLLYTSFYPGQPPVRVEITLQVHSFADPGTPLPVKVIGGFQSDSSGTGCLEGDAAVATTLPTLFKVRKRYLGPENETVTGPNFPQPYKIEVDVADGQTLDPLIVTENLPDSLVYLGPYGPPVAFAPPAGFPNGQIVLDFGKVTGTASDTDASFEFEFYAADKEADGDPVLDPETCRGLAIDDVRGEATWDPLDPKDPLGPVTSDVTPEDHHLELKCLAVQKHVAPLGPYIPGDELVYTLSFQVSDYVQAQDVVVTDLLSDGLQFLAQPAPKLTFADKHGFVQGDFTLGADAIVAKEPCGDGSTVVRFDVSRALATLGAGFFHQSGILTGGEVAPSPPSFPALGTITFHARIADEFDCPVPSKDQSVDKHDRVINQAAVAGEVLELAGEPGDVTAEDDTIPVVAEIAHGTVDKSIVARNGDPNDPFLALSPPLFAPGDTVTFQLSYCFPSSDAEDFRLEDFLPSPVFAAIDVKMTDVMLGPNDQLGIFPTPCPDEDGNVPLEFFDAAQNSVCFFFGNFDDPKNKRRCVEVHFTVPVTAEPFADGLVPTNVVSASERNSQNERFQQTRTERLRVGQPVIRVSKGAVSACCAPGSFLCTESVGTFAPEKTGPVFFNGPVLSCGVRFAPPLTSAGLAVTPIQSDVIGGIRAGDRIMFAVVVENTGFSPNGAFDVRVQESLLPPGLRFPPALQGGIALCVEDGAGNPLPYTGDLFGSGIELVDPSLTRGSLASGAGNATGSNLAVLTYILEVDPSLAAGACAANRAAVASYAGTEGGGSHVAAGLGGPHQQSAEVCRKPALGKSFALDLFRPIAVTSEPHTQRDGEFEELTIGEIARFRLVLEVPEGTLPDLRILDELPGGLTVLPGTVRIAFVSSGGTGLASGSLAAGPGLDMAGDETTVESVRPSFPFPPAVLPPTVDQTQHGRLQILLGDLTNTESDCDKEFVVIEFNALVGNDAVNQSGREAVNTARARWDGQFVDSNPVKLRIVEPRLRIAKTMRERLDNPLGRAVTLSITNPPPEKPTDPPTADAFDVVVTDELPESLFFELGTSPTVDLAGGVTGVTVTVSGKKVEVKIERIPVGGKVDVFFQVVLGGEVSCEATVNVANVTWTSLPGSKGTVSNPTGSATPGDSGLDNGERNGDEALGKNNTYHDLGAHSDFADCPPDLSVSKVCNHLSAQIRCFIVVTNLGPGQAESVTLSDVLPPGIQTESGLISGSGWSCSGTQELTCSYAEPLAPGEKTAELEILTRLFSGGWLLTGHNCAQAITEVDVNPANDFDCFGACPDGKRSNLDAFYEAFYEFPLELGDPCADFAERPRDFCQSLTPFKGDCGCGCFNEQPPPDIAVTKTCPAEGSGVCQIFVKNEGNGPAVGTLTVTDTLAPGVTLLVPGISGTNWRCDVTASEPKRVTCTWEGPPLAAGDSAPPLSLRLAPGPGATALPKNCARATLVGDANAANDLGCSKPPRCPDPKHPFIRYVSEDPAECATISFGCNGRLRYRFSDDCGCGCFCPAGNIWCR